MNVTEDLTRITGMTAKERQDCLRWIARQAEGFHVDLMRHRFKIFHSIKSSRAHPNLSLLELAALYIAAKGQGWLATRKMKTQRAPTGEEMRVISHRRKERAFKERHPAPKRSKLARVWGIVVELKDAGHSYGAISEYLQKAHKIKVTRQYLHQLFRKWENKEC